MEWSAISDQIRLVYFEYSMFSSGLNATLLTYGSGCKQHPQKQRFEEQIAQFEIRSQIELSITRGFNEFPGILNTDLTMDNS